MKNKNVVIVVFGRLSTKMGGNTDNFHYSVAKYFFDKGLLEKVYCIDCDSGVDMPDLYIEKLNESLLGKLFYKFAQYISLIYRDFPKRLFHEYIFDEMVAKKIQKTSAPMLLILKAVVPRIVRKSKQMGMRVLTLATVAHPRFNCDVVKKIQRQYNLPDRSIYTNETRVRRVSNTFRDSDKNIVLVRSEFILNTYVSNGISKKNLIVMDNSVGIDTKVFAPGKRNNGSSEIVFMTLGHLNLIKGIPLLLQAWCELYEEGNINAKLIIAGQMDGDIKSMIEEIHGDKNNIEAPGFVDNSLDVYNNADVFIAASISDNGPWTLIEAMACGLPVIVSSHCGFSEHIDEGKDGFVYNPFDIDRLKVLIKWFIENEAKIPEMGKNAREKTVSRKPVNFLDDLYRECSTYLDVEAVEKVQKSV